MLNERLEDGVIVLTINRPEQRNAMSASLVAALVAAFLRAEEDSTVRVLLLEGKDPGFCTGSDLSSLAASDSAGRQQFESESGRLARLLGCLTKPVVASVKGFAIGGGLTLATSCDIVLTEASARWGLPEVPIGLFPTWGLNSVVSRVGRSNARRLAFGIDTVTGTEAVRLGLADHLAKNDVATEALMLARRLAVLPAAQVAAVKSYFAANPEGEAADLLANRLFMAMAETPEATRTFEKFAKRRDIEEQ